jgi:hypothetical protein
MSEIPPFIVPLLAYIDPGAGSILLQAMLGGAAGVAVLVRMYSQRLRDRLKRSGSMADRSPES